ncbi:MAG: ABC transporter substrate-binding protein, partial [Chloroflexota bacterium]
TIASGQTPIVLDWAYNNGSQIDPLNKKGVTWKVSIPSDAPPVASWYVATINKDAAHPAAARCWAEYIYSDAGQNTWLKGFAIPVRVAAMTTAGTIDKAAQAALNPPATAPVLLTSAQIDAAKALLTSGWNFITIK